MTEYLPDFKSRVEGCRIKINDFEIVYIRDSNQHVKTKGYYQDGVFYEWVRTFESLKEMKFELRDI